MVRFSLASAALLFATVQAKEQGLRYTKDNGRIVRKLSYEPIAGYRPDTSVTDHNALDLDQKVIEEQVGMKTQTGFDLAKAVYEKGGHSKSYAKLTLDDAAADVSLPDGTVFEGKDTMDLDVNGKVYKSSTFGAGQLWLQYSTTDVQSKYVGCRVGGGSLVSTGDAVTDGCFKSSGTVSYGGTEYGYSYDIEADNHNGRTIKGFSDQVQKKMLDCAKCPYADAQYFTTYYGAPNYADIWVQAALAGGKTSFPSGKGTADFSEYGFTGRAECVKKGTAYMNIFMYVIREFEDAIDDCQLECPLRGCNDDAVHAWDEGVAFYAGSLEGFDGSGSGKLLHQLADKRCANFNTCVGETSESKVNKELFELFNEGAGQLIARNCEAARATKDKVVDLMYVPLIQGTLRYAYKNEFLQGEEKEKAEGAVFAASVLPRIHAADPEAAATIYDNMRVGASSTKFDDVKKAFESVYKDLNIQCSDVGGLLDKNGEYYKGASPCGKSKARKTGEAIGIAFGAIASVVAVGALAFVLVMRRREKQGNPIFKAPDGDNSAL